MRTMLFRSILLVQVFVLRVSLPAAEGLGAEGAALFLELTAKAGPPPGLRLRGVEWAAEGGGLEFTSPLQYAELDEEAMARFARAIDGAPAMTVGGWFFLRRAGEQCFLSRGLPRSGALGERLFPPEERWVNFCLGTDQHGFLMGTVHGNGGMPFPLVTLNEAREGSWSQLVLVKDARGFQQFYLNGRSIHSDRDAAAAGVVRPFREAEAGEPVRLSVPLGGRIGEVWIYPRALAAAEVERDFQAKRVRYRPAFAARPVALREMDARPPAGDRPFDPERARAAWLGILGPAPREKPPLDPQIHGEEDAGDHLRRKVSFAVEPGDRMTAWLLVPKVLRGRAPAAIAFYGTTSGAGKSTTVGLSGRKPGEPPHSNLSFALDLVRAGFVALAPDWLRDGERIDPGDAPYDTTRFYARHPDWSIHGKDAWDTSRAIDYLETLDFVDAGRIGMIGHSYGGHSTIFAAGLDPRIAAAAANGPVSAFREHGMHWGVPAGARNSQSLPALRRYLLDPDLELPVTFAEVTALIAPRPLWVGQAVGERRPLEEENHARVAAVYRRLGAGERVTYQWYPGDHDFPPAARRSAVEWLRRWLATGELAKVDLRRARIVTTHETVTPDGEFRIAHAIDGNPETKWIGEQHPLTQHPSSIVLDLEEPVAAARVVLVTQVFRERLALKDFEVYAGAGEEWDGRPLAVVKENREERAVADFPPVRVKRLRFRVLDTWREDHAFPRVFEIEVWRATGTGPAGEPVESPLLAEKRSERQLLERALGRARALPGTPFDPARGWLGHARDFLDTMLAEGTDRYGDKTSPLFASILDLEARRIPVEDPPAPLPGQRPGDRALTGGNLFQDVMLIEALDLATRLTGETKYRQAAEDCLRFFLERCPDPKTGLFPWGEHAYWDFFREAPAQPIHEFLGAPPLPCWERMWRINPEALKREGEGLLNHLTDLENFHFDRHADLHRPQPLPRPPGGGGLDFPRHAGFYIGLWSFLHSRNGDPRWLEWSLKMLDHHWRARHPRTGLLPVCTRGDRARIAAPEMMLSLAVSLLEAARLISPGEGPAGEVRARFGETARAYLDALLGLPHLPQEGKFLTALPIDGGNGAGREYSEPYAYVYGGGFTADFASLLVAAHRLTGDARARELAEAAAAFYARNEPPPATELVRAHVYASILGLFTDLYSLSGKAEHLEQAERHARLAVERLQYRGLFRGATGVEHYQADLMPGSLAYGLLRLAALKSNPRVEADPNYFHR